MSHDHSSMSGMSDTAAVMKMYFHASLPSADVIWFLSWIPSSGGAVFGACVGLFFLGVFERFLMAFKRGAEVYWRRDALRKLSPGIVSSTSTGISGAGNDENSSLDRSQGLGSTPAYRSQQGTLPDNVVDGDEITPATEKVDTQLTHRSSSSSKSAGATNAETRRDGVTSYLPSGVVKGGRKDRAQRWNVPFIWKNDVPRGIIESVAVLIHYLLMLVVMTFNVWYLIAIVAGAGVGETLFGRHGHLH